MRVRRTSLVGLLALALAAPAAVACKGNNKGGPATAGAPSGSVDDGEEIDRLEKEEVEAIGKAALALLEGQEAELPEVLVDNDGSVFIALRVKGEEVAEVWGDDGNLAASFKQAMKRARESAGGKTSEVDGIEIDIAHNFELSLIHISEPTRRM